MSLVCINASRVSYLLCGDALILSRSCRKVLANLIRQSDRRDEVADAEAEAHSQSCLGYAIYIYIFGDLSTSRMGMRRFLYIETLRHIE